jgi:hypothetical protein
MIDTLTRYLENVKNLRDRHGLRGPLETLVDRYSSQPLTSAGLVIKAGGSTLAKTGAAAFYGIAGGVPVTIAASTDMTALTGLVITATFFNVACFFIDSASVVTVAFGTQGATLAGVVFPPFPRGKALVGFLIITHSATFTGGTTALDTATTVYVSPLGPFDPSALI